MPNSQLNPEITAGGTAEDLLPADRERRSVLIQNLTHLAGGTNEGAWLNWLGDAGDGVGWYLGPGEYREMYARDWPEIRNRLSIWMATTGSLVAASGMTTQQ